MAVGEDSLPDRAISFRHKRGREPTEEVEAPTAGGAIGGIRNDTYGTQLIHAKRRCWVGGRLAYSSDAHGGRSPLDRGRGAGCALPPVDGLELHWLVRHRPLPGGG